MHIPETLNSDTQINPQMLHAPSRALISSFPVCTTNPSSLTSVNNILHGKHSKTM